MSKILASFILLMTVINAARTGEEDTGLHRRSLWNFGSMVRCATGWFPLTFNNYGCHCGFGGQGKIVDEIDRCCYEHDNCYRELVNNRTCGSYEIYYRSYKHSSCGICSAENKGCARGLCQCDSVAANCFKKNLHKFNSTNKNYHRTNDC